MSVVPAVAVLLVCWRPVRYTRARWYAHGWACLVVELFAQAACIASGEVAEPERDGSRRARWRSTKEPRAAW